MPLTPEEEQGITTQILQTRGCPVNCADRLDAFVAGVRAAVNELSDKLTVSKVEPVPANGELAEGECVPAEPGAV